MIDIDHDKTLGYDRLSLISDILQRGLSGKRCDLGNVKVFTYERTRLELACEAFAEFLRHETDALVDEKIDHHTEKYNHESRLSY